MHCPSWSKKKPRNSHIDRSVIRHSPLLDTSEHVLSNTSYPYSAHAWFFGVSKPKAGSSWWQRIASPSLIWNLGAPQPTSRFLLAACSHLCIPAYSSSVNLLILIIPINIQVHSHISYISYIDTESAYWPRSAKSLCWYGLFEILASARSEQTSSSPLARELTNLLWVHQQCMSSQPFNFRFGAKELKHVQTLNTQMWAPQYVFWSQNGICLGMFRLWNALISAWECDLWVLAAYDLAAKFCCFYYWPCFRCVAATTQVHPTARSHCTVHSHKCISRCETKSKDVSHVSVSKMLKQFETSSNQHLPIVPKATLLASTDEEPVWATPESPSDAVLGRPCCNPSNGQKGARCSLLPFSADINVYIIFICIS